jgi:hypothetical protein
MQAGTDCGDAPGGAFAGRNLLCRKVIDSLGKRLWECILQGTEGDGMIITPALVLLAPMGGGE